ncbi:type II toxin-antitoxin system HicB family antitoxin [Variovorax paradoxus]|uniref:type II toxin-antitoxin system HicB family antitoxin n=1 Tax=Variovorax paradoxus TaxID=34073 RepID=UPI0021AC42C8|nr:type II toxin-antitoxin system HicB family antitoxin [Variovorax paradoxus]UVH54708.1 type II toxin-antitoxin system HicB family antitoxin [Variovorax paradoxus]
MEEDRYTRITLRIPKDLHAKLDEAAEATSKSLNAEIVARLDKSFEPSAEAGLLAFVRRNEMQLAEMELALNYRSMRFAEAVSVLQRIAVAIERSPYMFDDLQGMTGTVNNLIDEATTLSDARNQSQALIGRVQGAQRRFDDAMQRLKEMATKAGPVESVKKVGILDVPPPFVDKNLPVPKYVKAMRPRPNAKPKP